MTRTTDLDALPASRRVSSPPPSDERAQAAKPAVRSDEFVIVDGDRHILTPRRSGPRRPAKFLGRQRLTDRLSDARGVRVTSVVAPAGYGKSVLAADWSTTAHARGRRFRFIALELTDNDPMLLWAEVAAAARDLGAPVDAGIESVLREELRQSRSEIPRTFLASLLGALEDVPQRGILVLDDLHLVQTPAIREALAFVVERLPPTIHLVLMSRAAITDLSLHRLRVRDELRELTARDLAFTPAEGDDFLRRVADIELEPETSSELVRRTEGWITGLKLATVAMREASDPAEYVRAFAGRDRDVADFLLGEVFSRQSPEVRTFLLETSILSSLSAGSCDAVTGRNDSAAQLRRLESGGIFLAGLDGNRDLYRYHSLFAEFLRAELKATAPTRVGALHRAASRWHEREGESAKAIDHALSGEEHERAAGLIVSLVAELHRRGLDGTLGHWFRALPDDVVANRAQLAVKRAWMHSYAGAPLEALRWCERADRAPDRPEDVRPESSCLRAHAYRTLGDLEAAVEWGKRARELLDRREPRSRHLDAYARLAMTDAVAEAYGLMGDHDSAIELLLEGLKRTREGGNDLAAVSIPGQLAALSSAMSRLDDAESYGRQAIVAAERLGLVGQPPIAEAEVALAEVSWERNDLQEAERRFLAAVDATRRSKRIWIRARALLGTARCRMSQRSPGEAFAILETVGGLYAWGEPPAFLAAQVGECQVRFRCAVGDSVGARDWLRRLNRLAPGHPGAAALESLVLVGEARGSEALAILNGLPVSGSQPALQAIERAVLRARAAEQAGGRREVLEALAAAVELAESQRFIRSLVEPAASLLIHSIRPLASGLGGRPPGVEYLRELDRAARAEQGRMAAGVLRPTHQPLGEPMSEAELAVIRFLPRDCTYAEIAASRFVSVNTVKSQLKSIYRRLGVSSRVSAIERCRELGLLSE